MSIISAKYIFRCKVTLLFAYIQIFYYLCAVKKHKTMTDTFILEGRICSTPRLRSIAAEAKSDKIYLQLKPDIRWVAYSQERMEALMDDTGAAMVYADRFQQQGGTVTQAPVIDCQEGALRDDFDFGSVLLVRTELMRKALEQTDRDWKYAGLYDLRLRLSRMGELLHVSEYMYYEHEEDTRKSGEKLFDYVDPKNREVQTEMEEAVTEHLKAVGAYLKPEFKDTDTEEGEFEYEASVVIPCKNRVRTIETAIRSALAQKTESRYKFNVIVVDDNSTDGTAEVIKRIVAEGHENLVYIAQDKTWHAIGGNWNAALHHEKCGRFAIQLDSDDTYSGPDTVQKFIDTFHRERCAMVIGTYQLTDFDGHQLPPGVIDHKEWTPDNGRNNALRINGLGAPRAFFTPLLRQLNFPTTKYGEDYAVGLRISREHKIGRIYDVLYNCRRWDDNSDANCDIQTMNANNLYKDRLRTWELKARIALNRQKRK